MALCCLSYLYDGMSFLSLHGRVFRFLLCPLYRARRSSIVRTHAHTDTCPPPPLLKWKQPSSCQHVKGHFQCLKCTGSKQSRLEVNKVALTALKYFIALIWATIISQINALTLTALINTDHLPCFICQKTNRSKPTQFTVLLTLSKIFIYKQCCCCKILIDNVVTSLSGQHNMPSKVTGYIHPSKCPLISSSEVRSGLKHGVNEAVSR